MEPMEVGSHGNVEMGSVEMGKWGQILTSDIWEMGKWGQILTSDNKQSRSFSNCNLTFLSSTINVLNLPTAFDIAE